MDLPRWAALGRRGWKYTGQQRPPFADTPGPGQESVWDYPRPAVAVAETRRVRVELDGALIADTRRAFRVLETSHPPSFYLPPDDIDLSLLRPAGGGSRCEWKGEASYYDVVLAPQLGGKQPSERRVARAAWSYDAPFDEFACIAGWLSFYPGKLACFVADERVRPQPGGFYGGWITSDLAGPFKGA